MAVVETQKQGDVAVIRMDNPPVNALGHALRVGLEKAFNEANADAGVKAIVLTGTGRFFSAGADITEFKLGDEGALPAAADRPHRGVRQAGGRGRQRHGAGRRARAGAGLPLPRRRPRTCASWACPRSSSASSRAPAARSACRAPSASSRPCSSSPQATFIDAHKGAAAGLIDKLADGDVVAAAVAFAKEQVGKPPRRIGEKKIDKASFPAGLFEKARASLGRHPSGPIAPKAAIDAVEAATTLPIAEGQARERAGVPRGGGQPLRARPAVRLLRRAPGRQPAGHRPRHQAARHQDGRHSRRRHHGHRHRPRLPQRRLPRDHRRDHAGGARPGRRPHQGHALGQRQARAHHRVAGRGPHRQAHAVAEDGGPRQGRPHHRGRVREHGAQEGDLRRSSTKSPSRAPSSPATPPRSTSTRSPPSPSGRRTWWACISSRPPTSCGCWRSCAPRRPPTT